MNYDIIKTDIELAKLTIDFFTAKFTNPTFYKEIVDALSVNADNPKYIQIGYLSINDFVRYLNIKNYTRQIRLKLIQTVLDGMETNLILQTNPIKPGSNIYMTHEYYSTYYYNKELILILICGWQMIIDTYRHSVFKIETQIKIKDSLEVETSIGTGFYYSIDDGDKGIRHLIVTNRHVVEKAVSFKIINENNEEIEYQNIFIDKKRDLAFIELKESLSVPTFHFNKENKILSELLTIGYPSVPLTKYAYQIYHKGELNSFVEDYFNNKLFLFSAKTSSGNSGSPIIDKSGMVIGIVTEELFEENEFFKKGKLPYYAGIPSDEIIQSIKENVLI